MIPIMFDVLLDMRNMLEGDVLGHPTLLGFGILLILFILLMVCRVPPLFAFLLIVPASYGLFRIGIMDVAWFWGVVVLMLGILLARVIMAFVSRE